MADIGLDGNTPLHTAIVNGDPIDALIATEEGKLFINKQNVLGQTPAHIAACEGNLYAMKALQTNKALLDIQDINGNTPLHIAAGEHSNVLLAMLPSAHMDIKNVKGETALDVATRLGINENVSALAPVAAPGPGAPAVAPGPGAPAVAPGPGAPAVVPGAPAAAPGAPAAAPGPGAPVSAPAPDPIDIFSGIDFADMPGTEPVTPSVSADPGMLSSSPLAKPFNLITIEEYKPEMNANPVILLNSVIPTKVSQTIEDLLKAVEAKNISAINRVSTEEFIRNGKIMPPTLKKFLFFDPSTPYSTPADLLGEQLAFLCFFNHLFFLAALKKVEGAKFSDNFEKKFKFISGAMEQAADEKKPLFGNEDAALDAIWQSAQKVYITDQSRLKTYADIKGFMIAGPERVILYFSDGLARSEGKVPAKFDSGMTRGPASSVSSFGSGSGPGSDPGPAAPPAASPKPKPKSCMKSISPTASTTKPKSPAASTTKPKSPAASGATITKPSLTASWPTYTSTKHTSTNRENDSDRKYDSDSKDDPEHESNVVSYSQQLVNYNRNAQTRRNGDPRSKQKLVSFANQLASYNKNSKTRRRKRK